jgi:hypothetical protein
LLKYRRLPVAMIAACLAVGLTAAPSAVAASKPTAKSVNAKLTKTNKSLTSTRKSLSKVTKDLGALAAALKGEQGKTALLLGAAPQLVDGLTKLSSAVQNQIAPGLIALQTALEKQVSPALKALEEAVKVTIPAAVKQGITDVATTQEYGVAGITVTGVGAVQVGNDTVSSDIPEDGNPAVAKGTALVASGAGGAINFVLRAKIRSAEDDGDSVSETAGQAGGFVTIKRVDAATPQSDATPITTYNQAGVLQDCFDDDVTTGGAQNVFVFGTPTGETITTPSGNVTNLPLKNIPGGVARTDTTGVQAGSTSLFPTSGPLQQCTITAGAANELYEVNYTVNFVDIPTTTTPGPRD